MFDENEDLSFDRNLFKEPSFNSDDFLIQYKQKVDLETLQNDLAAYSKEISTEVYDVISENYDNFLKFTNELSYFEKSFRDFVNPFNSLKNEIENVGLSLDDCEVQAKACISDAIRQQEKIDENKHCQNFVQKLDECETFLSENDLIINEYIANDKTTLANLTKGNCEIESQTVYLLLQKLERCANEYGPLLYTLKTFSKNEKVSQRNEKMDNILAKMLHQLELLFLRRIGLFNRGCGALEADDTKLLREIMIIYALINQYNEAENLFKIKCARPNLKKIIKMENIQDISRDLTRVYEAIYKFMGHQIAPILRLSGCDLTQLTSPLQLNDAKSYTDFEPVPGFDFVKYSVWPEIVRNFEITMTPIYAPANPDTFHKNYTDTLHFLDKLESLFATERDIVEFRKLSSYHDFLVKPWHLSVYFQIRFQELAGAFEDALSNDFYQLNPHSNTIRPSPDHSYYLSVSRLLKESVEACWDDTRIYLSILAHKFWKLSLQMISRHRHWLKHDVIQQPQSITNEAFGIYLIADIKTLSGELPQIFETVVSPKLRPLLQNCRTDSRKNADLQSFKDIFLSHTLKDYTEIVCEIMGVMIQRYLLYNYDVTIKRINDIPRIYRHTKRMPKEPSEYVHEMVQPIKDFIQKINDNCKPNDREIKTIRDEIMEAGFKRLTERFLGTIKELLVNVHKTEESLLRLKKVKGLLNANPNPDNKSEMTSSSAKEETIPTYATDGDKIKGQLRLDVEAYGNLVKKLGVDLDNIEQYQILINTIRKSLNPEQQS